MLPWKILKSPCSLRLILHSECIIIPFWLTTYGINCVIFFLSWADLMFWTGEEKTGYGEKQTTRICSLIFLSFVEILSIITS